MRTKIPAGGPLPPHNSSRAFGTTHSRPAPWLVLIGLTIVLLSSGCGDTISKPRRNRAAQALSSVIVAVQHGRDSTTRFRLADSAARAQGFDGWLDLKGELEEIAVFPEHMRELLDSTAPPRVGVK